MSESKEETKTKTKTKTKPRPKRVYERKKCCDEYKGDEDQKAIEMPSGIHTIKMVCKYCGKFSKWGTGKKTLEKMKNREILIDDCLLADSTSPVYTEKQASFLENIKKLRHLTFSQQNYLSSLANKAHIDSERIELVLN